MQVKGHLLRASWTLIDQGVVSLGAFLVNILLARHLPSVEYGTFALLFGGLLALQIVNSSLIFYPLSVRLILAQGDEHAKLVSGSVILVIGTCLPLSALLTLTLLALGRSELVLPAVVWFLAWQMQEAMRRCLLANFRHRTAVIGDAVTYFGQAAIVAGLIATDSLTLTNVLCSMAIPPALAAIIQARQLGLSLRGPHDLRRIATIYWSIGNWSVANNLLSLVRLQIFPWALAAASGPAAAASFQAAVNVVNLAHPVIIGLANVIPQAVAHARANGNYEAWRSARIYALIGAVPTFVYYALAFIAPELILRVFYGAESPYLTLSLAVRLLVLAWVAGYVTDMICAFLHGVVAARLALVINAAGMATAVVLAWPLTGMLGLVGACLALIAANIVRLVTSQFQLTRMIADERPLVA